VSRCLPACLPKGHGSHSQSSYDLCSNLCCVELVPLEPVGSTGTNTPLSKGHNNFAGCVSVTLMIVTEFKILDRQVHIFIHILDRQVHINGQFL